MAGESGATALVNGERWQMGTSDETHRVPQLPGIRGLGYRHHAAVCVLRLGAYPLDGVFYPYGICQRLLSLRRTLGEEHSRRTYTIEGDSGRTRAYTYDSGFELYIDDEQTQPFTVTAVSVANPEKTGRYTAQVTPCPVLTQALVNWDPSLLRLSGQMTLYDAKRAFQNIGHPVGEGPHAIPLGEQAYAQPRYCGVSYMKDDGRYSFISDSMDTTPLDADETYYIKIDVELEWPYRMDAHPPRVSRVNDPAMALKKRGAQNTDDVVCDTQTCRAYFRLPAGFVTEKLWVEQVDVTMTSRPPAITRR